MGARYVTEVLEEKKRALVVFEKKNKVVLAVLQILHKTHTVYETNNINDRLSGYDLAVFVNLFPEEPDELKNNKKNYFIFLNNKGEFKTAKNWLEKNLRAYKLINVGLIKKPLLEFIQFFFYKTSLPYCFDYAPKMIRQPLIIKTTDPKQTVLQILKYIFSLILLFNLLFFICFLLEWLLLFDLWRGKKDLPTIQTKIVRVAQVKNISNGLYLAPKNTLFWVPGIDQVFNFVDTTQKTVLVLEKAHHLAENYNLLVRLALKKNKNVSEEKETKLRIKYLNKVFNEFNSLYFELFADWKRTNTPLFNTKKNKLLQKATQLEEYLVLAEKINKQLPYLLGAEEKRKYLVLFMNNMELRPGGGFIGSIGVIEVEDFSLKEIKIYDVYTLDGQLKTHIEPPQAIKKYLNQPHWFLRDSNFSADFSTNANEAMRFIKKEVDWDDFDGVFGITLSAVQKTLTLFPDFYLDDYNEIITADNFFIKAQTYAEKDFFPGSHSKKNFLASTTTALIVKLEESNFDYWQFAEVVREVFEEKFAVLYFKNPEIQSAFDDLFWTGRLVNPGCSFGADCFFDYLYVVDANLGVNKTNFFIQRSIRLITIIDEKSIVSNRLVINYKNESVKDIFPGGVYKNFVQIYLPNNIKVQSVKVEGEETIEYSSEDELGYKKIGLLISVQPGSSKNIVLDYVFNEGINGLDQYQLIVQKQVGSVNNDLIIEMNFPSNTALVNTNFSPIVNQSGFVYNTFLQKDRLLLINIKQK